MALRTIDQPSYFRSGVNNTGVDIGKNLIIKVDPANVDGILIDTAVTTPKAGVTTEIIYAGKSASYQFEGKTVVTAGAAVAVGDGVSSDGSGRAIKGTAALTYRNLGRAVTAAAALGDLIEVELGQEGNLN